jgi:hypothetical protein
MRKARVLSVAAVGVVLAVATLAFAQGRGRPGVRPKPKADAGAGDNSSDDKTAASAAAAASGSAGAPPSTAPASSTGVVPAPASDLTADGGKLSPLNPAANEFSDAGASAPSIDYDRLLADVAALRARVAAVSDTLFHSRIAVTMETSGSHARIARLAVSLDDGVVWTAPSQFRAEDATPVYDHAVAPGKHAVTVEVERRDDRDDSFRSADRSRFVVDVPADQKLDVALKLWDDSTMGGDFPGDKSGVYLLRVRATAKAQPVGK